jgi:hypothetical protein
MGFKFRKKAKASFAKKKKQASLAGMDQKPPTPYGRPVKVSGCFMTRPVSICEAQLTERALNTFKLHKY